ncbi:response regulator, partial [Acinetobacter baumannii]
IIDDDAEMRGSLDSLLRSTGYEVVPFASTREFLGHALAETPSCLVLDIRLQAESGLDFQERLARENIRIPVVLMTGHGDIPMTVRGMKAGAV